MNAMPTAASGFLRIEFAQLVLGLGELLAVGEKFAALPVERRRRLGGLGPQLIEIGSGDELLGAVHSVSGLLGGRGKGCGGRRPSRLVVRVRHLRPSAVFICAFAPPRWRNRVAHAGPTTRETLPHFAVFDKVGPPSAFRAHATRSVTPGGPDDPPAGVGSGRSDSVGLRIISTGEAEAAAM